MPVAFQYDAEKRALFGVMSGELTLADFSAAVREIVASEDHPPDVRSLWDLRDLEFEKITRDFEEELIEFRASFPERGSARIAFVVSDDLGFGMTRMFEMLSQELGNETEVFRSFAEAESWLLSK